jgi:hypothetical protein
MTVILRCPGVDRRSHRHGQTTVHADGCCAQFILASAEVRERTGLRISMHEPSAEPRPVPPVPKSITVPELISLVTELQRDAAQFPDEVPDDLMVWVDITPEYDLDEVMALIDLGRPYGLVVGWRRVLNSPEANA